MLGVGWEGIARKHLIRTLHWEELMRRLRCYVLDGLFTGASGLFRRHGKLHIGMDDF